MTAISSKQARTESLGLIHLQVINISAHLECLRKTMDSPMGLSLPQVPNLLPEVHEISKSAKVILKRLGEALNEMERGGKTPTV